jgi:hypothetical protein
MGQIYAPHPIGPAEAANGGLCAAMALTPDDGGLEAESLHVVRVGVGARSVWSETPAQSVRER